MHIQGAKILASCGSAVEWKSKCPSDSLLCKSLQRNCTDSEYKTEISLRKHCKGDPKNQKVTSDETFDHQLDRILDHLKKKDVEAGLKVVFPDKLNKKALANKAGKE